MRLKNKGNGGDKRKDRRNNMEWGKKNLHEKNPKNKKISN